MKLAYKSWIVLVLILNQASVTATSQTGEKLTQKAFNEQVQKAFESKDEKRLETLIRENRYRVAALVSKFLESYLKAELKLNQEEAHTHIDQTQQLATIFHKAFGDEKFLKRVKLWLGWSKAEKMNKASADSLRKVGGRLYYKSQYSEALTSFETALHLYREIKDSNGESLALNNIGVVYKRWSDFPRAISYYEQALQLAREIDDKRSIWINVNSIANIYLMQGDFQEAKGYYGQMFEILQLIGDQKDFMGGYGSMGVIAFHLGDYSTALNYYLRSLKIAQELGDKRSERISLSNIGNLHFDLDDFDQALGYFQQALQLARADSNRYGETSGLINLGGVYFKQKEYEKAHINYQQALIISREIGDRFLEENALTNLGSVQKKLKNYQKALQYHQKALTIQKEINEKRAMAINLGEMASLYEEMDDHFHALKYLRQALEVALQMGSPAEIWNAQESLGAALKKQGKTEEALHYLTQAVETIESIRAKIQSAPFKASFMEGKIAIYESLIDLLVANQKDEEAFNYSERAKARALLDILSINNIDITEGISAVLLEKKNRIERKLNNIYDELSVQISKPSEQQNLDTIAEFEDSLKFVENDYEVILNEIRQRHPQYAELVGVREPLTLKQLQENVLDESSVLIEYMVTEEKIFVSIVGKNFFQHEAIVVSREKLQSMVTELLQPLLHAGEQQNIADIGFDLKLSQQLYEKIFRPAEKFLPEGSSVIIVPDDILFHLPFEALATSIERRKPDRKAIFSRYKNAHYLIEKYSMSYVPSASILDPELRQRQKEKSAGFLAFGNPDFGGKTTQMTQEEKQHGIFNFFSMLTRGPEPDTWTYPQLPFSELEVQEISKVIKPSKTLIGPEAKEETFKELAGQCQYLHISTHAVTEEKQPMYSRIIFAQDEDPEEDGFHHAYEVLNLRLNADLVTLSACKTGLGKLSRGEGLIGLTRAFMYAGAPSILVSLWSVDDASTATLMKYFYENLKKGKPKSESLRQAKLKMLKTRKRGMSFAMPYLWAPFVLVGDGI